jgi:hypothetical protein
MIRWQLIGANIVYDLENNSLEVTGDLSDQVKYLIENTRGLRGHFSGINPQLSDLLYVLSTELKIFSPQIVEGAELIADWKDPVVPENSVD